MAAAAEPSSENNTSTKDAKPSRMRRFFRRWRFKGKPNKNTTDDSPIHTPGKKQEPAAKQHSTTITNDEDEQEDKSPMRFVSPKPTDATPPTPFRRRPFWNMKTTPQLHPSPLSSSTSHAAATELQATPTPVAKKGMSAAEIKQAMSAFTVPEPKTELEINASLAQSPGKGEALGSHPPSLHDEDAVVPPVVGGEKGRPGLGRGQRSERRGNRSTELVG